MSMLRSVGGWGIILFGTIILGIGYSLTLSTPMNLGKTDTIAIGMQMEQIGFMLIVAGFAAWILVYFFRQMRWFGL